MSGGPARGGEREGGLIFPLVAALLKLHLLREEPSYHGSSRSWQLGPPLPTPEANSYMNESLNLDTTPPARTQVFFKHKILANNTNTTFALKANIFFFFLQEWYLYKDRGCPRTYLFFLHIHLNENTSVSVAQPSRLVESSSGERQPEPLDLNSWEESFSTLPLASRGRGGGYPGLSVHAVPE